MNERIKELRKALGISQKEFAEKIGLKQCSLSDIERSRTGVSNSNIIIICKIFDVSEDWLRNGEGEIFAKESDSKYQVNNFTEDFLLRFENLNYFQQKALVDLINSMKN